jgi:hypothetical protein
METAVDERAALSMTGPFCAGDVRKKSAIWTPR